jgi:hypothetical protein
VLELGNDASFISSLQRYLPITSTGPPYQLRPTRAYLYHAQIPCVVITSTLKCRKLHLPVNQARPQVHKPRTTLQPAGRLATGLPVPLLSKSPRYDHRCCIAPVGYSLGVFWLLLLRVSRATGSLLPRPSCLHLFRFWHTLPIPVPRHLLTVNMRSLPFQTRYPLGSPLPTIPST